MSPLPSSSFTLMPHTSLIRRQGYTSLDRDRSYGTDRTVNKSKADHRVSITKDFEETFDHEGEDGSGDPCAAPK